LSLRKETKVNQDNEVVNIRKKEIEKVDENKKSKMQTRSSQKISLIQKTEISKIAGTLSGIQNLARKIIASTKNLKRRTSPRTASFKNMPEIDQDDEIVENRNKGTEKIEDDKKVRRRRSSRRTSLTLKTSVNDKENERAKTIKKEFEEIGKKVEKKKVEKVEKIGKPLKKKIK